MTCKSFSLLLLASLPFSDGLADALDTSMQILYPKIKMFYFAVLSWAVVQAAQLRPIARWKLDDLYSNTIFESTGFGDTLGGTSCLPGQLFGQTHGGWPLSARWNPHAGIIHSPSGKGALRMHTGNGREYAVLAGCITNVLASGFIFKLQYLNNTCKSFRIFCAHF